MGSTSSVVDNFSVGVAVSWVKFAGSTLSVADIAGLEVKVTLVEKLSSVVEMVGLPLEVFGSGASAVGVSDVCVEISWLKAVDSEASLVEGAFVEVRRMSGSYWCGDG